MTAIPAHADVVVIGGGIIGCSVAYHLARDHKLDVVLIEQGKLTGGSTWHAAGLVGQLRSSASITQVLRYSVDLYKGLEAETGLATGWRETGCLRLACNEDRWTEFKRQATTARSFQPTHPQFEALRKALIAERRGTAAKPVADKPEDVVVPSGPTLKLGVEHGQVALLRKRLDVPAKDGANEYVFDAALRDAVVAFQRTQGGKPDGMVGSGTRQMLNGGSSTPEVSGQKKIDLLLVNMERYRWLPQNLGSFYVNVNIPEFKVRVFQDAEPIHETRVVVGKTHTQTPIFNDEMEEIVFRPNWYVPNSIKSNEIAPYLRRGSGFFSSGWDTSILRRQGLRIRGPNGRDIDPDRVDWSRNDIRRYELYQPPGPSNVLGLVKFRFPNTHDVYLHDTTQKGLFANAERAYSHGCVRVQNPDKLATVLLGHDQDWTQARVSAAMYNGADANAVRIKNRIPVYISYFTAIVDEDGQLKQYKDLYGHDRRMIAALNGQPIPAGLPDNTVASAGQGERRGVRRSRRGDNPFSAIFDF